MIAFISGVVYWILEVGLLGTEGTYPFSGEVYSPGNSFIGVILGALLFGTVLGVIEETFFKTKFQSNSFVVKITLKTLIYITLLLCLLFIQSLAINAINTGKSIFEEEIINTVLAFFSSLTILGVLVYIGFIITLALISSEIIDYLGLDVVSSFFTGRYNRSVIEERIFMFLDMKSSTAIAEKLGHKKHYQFVNEYYNDMTNAIIETKGRIYQYAGDEIIVSWSLDKGLYRSNCLKCFFLIKQAIDDKKQSYLNKYGVSPRFKAGLHYGKVTRGQVGFIKKELLFTGDVLNTTARIQNMCKELEADFLISGSLKNLIADPNFGFINKGSYPLRGRKKAEVLIQVISE